MACEFMIEKRELLSGAAPDIVDDAPGARDNTDMGQGAAHETRENISGPPCCGISRDGQHSSPAREESLEIGHTAVIDIVVGRLEAPAFGVSGKGALHIRIYQCLKVNLERVTVRPDYNIGADALCAVHVSARKAQLAVSGIIGKSHANLFARGCDQLCGAAGLLLGNGRTGKEGRRHQTRDELATINHSSASKLAACARSQLPR